MFVSWLDNSQRRPCVFKWPGRMISHASSMALLLAMIVILSGITSETHFHGAKNMDLNNFMI